MELPFTESAFLDLFGFYNRALWPVVAAAWFVSLVVVIRSWRGSHAGREVLWLLAAHWLWSGVVYHWLYFRSINPAAVAFAGLFVAQGVLFAWAAVTHRGRVDFDRSPRAWAGLALVAYGFAYPLVGLLFGLDYPRLPLFAVPCPTVLITAGLLLLLTGLPRVMSVVPILWTAIGGSAAVLLGIRADRALIVAGGLLVLDALIGRWGGAARVSTGPS